MFDRSACAKVHLTADAHTDVPALVALGTLLQGVLHDRFAAPNAPDSDVSSLSRDQTRREGHATPKQADTGTPQRATTNRSVRRRATDGGRQRAGLVRAADADTDSADQPDDAVDPGACRPQADWPNDGGLS